MHLIKIVTIKTGEYGPELQTEFSRSQAKVTWKLFKLLNEVISIFV